MEQQAVEQDQEKVCAICLEELGTETVTPYKCKHQYHSACADRWHQVNPNSTCPYCRAEREITSAEPEPLREAANRDVAAALMSAARFGREAAVNRLIHAGADINAANWFGHTALILAAQYGNEAVVKRLIEAGADIDAADNDGNTVLMLAAQFGHEAVVNRLVEAGAR